MINCQRLVLPTFYLIIITLLLISCGASILSVDPTATPIPLPPTLIAGQYTYDDLIHVFNYDPQEPLDIQEVSVSDEEDGIKLHDISYAGAIGDRVSAFLVEPPGEGPFAGVIFMHQGFGSRNSFLNEEAQQDRLEWLSTELNLP